MSPYLIHSNHTTMVATAESLSTSLEPNVNHGSIADSDEKTTKLLAFGLLAVFFGFCTGIVVLDMFRKYKTGELQSDARGTKSLCTAITKAICRGFVSLFKKKTWSFLVPPFTKSENASKIALNDFQERNNESMVIINRFAVKPGNPNAILTDIAVVDVDTDVSTVTETNIQVIITPPSPLMDPAAHFMITDKEESVKTTPAYITPSSPYDTSSAEDTDMRMEAAESTIFADDGSVRSRRSSLYSLDISIIDHDFGTLPASP